MKKETPAKKAEKERYAKARLMDRNGYSPAQIGNACGKSTEWARGVLRGRIGKGK
jgi:hypothetical protein